MGRLRSFSRLSGVERRLVLKATLLLGVIRLGLWVLPFETLRRLLSGFSEGPVRLRDIDRSSVGEVTWAVEKAGRLMPVAATCLTLALTGQVLLMRRRHEAVIHIGVAKRDGERFLAHAWVESGGKIVIGDHELEHYTPLTSLGGSGVQRPSERSSSVSGV